jgi:hypothetical protein
LAPYKLPFVIYFTLDGMTRAAVLLAIARVLVAVIALVFIVGQVVFGKLFLASSLAGVFGLIAAVLGYRGFARRYPYGFLWLIGCVALAFLGVLLEAHDYYGDRNVPGNDFAWEIRAPFLVGLFYIAFSATRFADTVYGEKHAV